VEWKEWPLAENSVTGEGSDIPSNPILSCWVNLIDIYSNYG